MKRYMVYEIRYNKEDDAFETWLAVENHEPKEEDFGLEISCMCMKYEGQETGEPNHIHFEILKHIARAQALGYKIVWKI